MPDRSTIDRLDRKILDVLQEDGRITNQDLADQVGLSASACLARVKKMEQSGIIRGYKAQVDATKLRPNLTIFAEVTTSAGDIESQRKIEQKWLEMSQVVEAFQVSGRYDYLVRFLMPDMDSWAKLVADLTDSDLNIETIRTTPMVRRVKLWRGVPMEATKRGLSSDG